MEYMEAKMQDQLEASMARAEEAAGCPMCDGKGWRWSLPRGMNPFEAGAAVMASNMRKVECDHVVTPINDK